MCRRRSWNLTVTDRRATPVTLQHSHVFSKLAYAMHRTSGPGHPLNSVFVQHGFLYPIVNNTSFRSALCLRVMPARSSVWLPSCNLIYN